MKQSRKPAVPQKQQQQLGLTSSKTREQFDEDNKIPCVYSMKFYQIPLMLSVLLTALCYLGIYVFFH